MPNDVTRQHLSRLHQVYRSAGWPCHDAVELDLLAGGLIERHLDTCGREVLTLTALGVDTLHERLTRGRQRLSAHERLCRATAEWQAANGRLAFLGTSFRTKVEESWRIARPDVVSIRRTTREELLAPVVYEVKVSRADLLGDVARPHKRLAYRQLAGEMYYVVSAGIAGAEDVPSECGLIEHVDGAFTILRAASASPCQWSFASWMALLLSERIPAAADGLPQPDLHGEI